MDTGVHRTQHQCKQVYVHNTHFLNQRFGRYVNLTNTKKTAFAYPHQCRVTHLQVYIRFLGRYHASQELNGVHKRSPGNVTEFALEVTGEVESYIVVQQVGSALIQYTPLYINIHVTAKYISRCQYTRYTKVHLSMSIYTPHQGIPLYVNLHVTASYTSLCQ